MILSPPTIEAVKASAFYQTLSNERVFATDNSSFSNSGCPIKWVYGSVLKRTSSRGKSPLVFGAAFHTGLEHFHKGFSREASLKVAVEQATKEGLDGIQDEKRSVATLAQILPAYFQDYDMRGEKFDVVEDPFTHEKLVEKSFSLPLGEFMVNDRVHTVVWQGKIDLIARYRGGLWVVDHKTTSIMGEKFTDDKVRSSQVLGYIWAAQQMTKFLGEPIRGVLINTVCLRKAGYDFQVFELPIPQWQVVEWAEETVNQARVNTEMLQQAVTDGLLLPNREQCVTKYGKCPFFDVCQMHPTVKDRVLFDPAIFVESKWSPLD